MDRITSFLVIVIGILILLPLVGVTQLGTIVSGIAAWIIGLILLITGILELANANKNKKLIDKN